MAKLLWVEDQTHWLDKFQSVLESTDFDGNANQLMTFKFANAAKQKIGLMAAVEQPDIAILDAHMNGNSGAGFSVARVLLKKWPDLPIIYLSEHSGTATEEMAFDLNAQDFIAKHQRNVEEVLCWRIKAVLRQTKSTQQNTAELLTSGDLKIDCLTWEIYWRGNKLMNPNNPRRPLAPMPRKILFHLVKSTPRPVSTVQMAEFLEHDPEKFSYANYRQHIKTLRYSLDNAEKTSGDFLAACKSGQGIVTFGDLEAYSWKVIT